MNQSAGHTTVQIFRNLFVAMAKAVAIVLAWSCKITGTILSAIGDFIIKHMQK